MRQSGATPPLVKAGFFPGQLEQEELSGRGRPKNCQFSSVRLAGKHLNQPRVPLCSQRKNDRGICLAQQQLKTRPGHCQSPGQGKVEEFLRECEKDLELYEFSNIKKDPI